MADYLNIAGRVRTTANDGVSIEAQEIKDLRKDKFQQDINQETDEHLAQIDSDLDTPSGGVKDRLSTLESQVAFSGEFQAENTPQGIISESGKIATANAVRGAIDVRTGYFICETAADINPKTVNATGFVLTNGGALKIKMANANTIDNVTLDINNIGEKPLYYNGEAASAINTWEAYEVVEVYYDSSFDSGNGAYFANNVAGGSGDGVFDISAKTGNSYAKLDNALAAADSILSQSKKKGGMSIKFIHSSYNKYVQYRLMATSWSTTAAQWQGVDDEPTAGSHNFVESGGVYDVTSKLREDVGNKQSTTTRHDIDITPGWNSGKAIVADDQNENFGKSTTSTANSASGYFDVSAYAGKILHYTRLKTTSESSLYGLVFFTEKNIAASVSPGYLIGTNAAEMGYELVEVTIPNNAVYARFTMRTEFLEDFEAYVMITEGGDYTDGLGKRIQDLESTVEDLPQILDSYTDGNIATISPEGSFTDSGRAIVSEIGLNALKADANNVPDNKALINLFAAKDAVVGKYVFIPPIGNSYITFPIKSGEKLFVKVVSSGGSSSSLTARTTNSSTNQQLICELSAITNYTFVAERDFDRLYIYGVSAQDCKIEILRESSIAGDVSALRLVVDELSPMLSEGRMYYSYKAEAATNHNASHLMVYCNVSETIYIRYRIGLYNTSAYGPANKAKTYWRLENAVFCTYNGETFTVISGANLLTDGENEFVIRQTEPNKVDFTGGYHGDEYIYDNNGNLIGGAFAEFYVDDALISLGSDDINLTPCKKFWYKEYSPMYETVNSSGSETNVGRLIAWHTKQTVFTHEGYTTENRLDLVEDIPYYAFTGIVCVDRYVSQYAMGEQNQLTDMGTGEPNIEEQFKNVGNSKIFYKGNGYTVLVDSHVEFGDDDGKQTVFVNNHTQYNKYYRKSQILSNGEKLKSITCVKVTKIE